MTLGVEEVANRAEPTLRTAIPEPERASVAAPTWFMVSRVRVSSVDLRSALDKFFSDTSGGYVALASAHGVVESCADDRLCEIMNAARMVLPDGAPLFWIGRMKIGRQVGRVPGTEFFRAVLADPRGARLRHYFYGADAETLALVVSTAAELVGPDAIAGAYAPPFRPAGSPEDEAVIKRICATRPDVVWVGLSTPKQEYWMANHTARLPGVICVGVGAAFDFLIARKTRGPLLMSKMGLEWLWRLMSEPGRLWPRYRVVVPFMLMVLMKEAAGTLVRRTGSLDERRG